MNTDFFFLSVPELMAFSIPKQNLWEKYVCEIAQVISQFTHAIFFFLIQLGTSFWQHCL